MSGFQLISPSALLSPYVKHYWVLHTGEGCGFTERVVPTGNMQLLFYSGGTVYTGQNSWQATSVLSGHSTGYVDLLGAEAIRIIVVVFHPWGARAFFTFPLDEVCNLKVTADELSDHPLRELQNRVINQPDEKECIRLIEDFLYQRLRLGKEYNFERMSEAIRLIDTHAGDISISHLSEAACLSNKQFHRVFTDHIGIRPKEFLRIVRFQSALSRMNRSTGRDFTQLAYECGYYDQSHLIHEFRKFTGYTLREYVSLCDPYSDYFQS